MAGRADVRPAKALQPSCRTDQALRMVARSGSPNGHISKLAAAPAPRSSSPLKSSKSARSAVSLTQHLSMSANGEFERLELLRLLAEARNSRLQTRKRARQRRTGDQITLADLPSLEEMPTLAMLEDHPLVPEAAILALRDAQDEARLEKLALIDAYVADFGGGEVLEIMDPAMKAIGVDDAWVSRPKIQRALALMRAQQQEVVSTLSAEAGRRPLEFAKTGTRFWPRDLEPDQLRRLDRWAYDPGFQRDVDPIETDVRKVHRARDEAQYRAFVAESKNRKVVHSNDGKQPDGFGGWRETPAPSHMHREVFPVVPPFDPVTGDPHPSLLKLLLYSARNPHSLAFADDGRLTLLPGGSKAITRLIQMWRQEDRVEALVVGTVKASRKEGKPMLPRRYEALIAAMKSERKQKRHRNAALASMMKDRQR